MYLSDTSAFAAVIADALGIEGEAASSLDHLEAHLVNRARTTPPTACMIDDLEHVLLQSPGGTALLQRVLVFFSRTDTSVYWIATIARQAWHFFTKTGGAAAQLVTAYPLERLDRDVLRDIVNNRHGRTGLPLRFATRSDLSPILRQRLRRARVESKKQALLRDWYFESLHRESGEDIMLAMFYWLRSADFAAAEETLTIEPIDALSFRFLDAFDLARTFTLKALVIHNTLSLDEHARIFRMNEEQSTIQLESLLTLRLIEPASPEGKTDGRPAHGHVVPGQRYRLRRLILHPVIRHLRDRNLVT